MILYFMNGEMRYNVFKEGEIDMLKPFKRKIYDEMLEWKEDKSDKYALLIKGARRVGKSTIAEEFAKNEFKSYIMIDFAHTTKEITTLFDNMYNLDYFLTSFFNYNNSQIQDYIKMNQ